MKFQCNKGASQTEIAHINPAIQGFLPQDYLDFIRRCNGGEGFVSDEYLMLWRIEELYEFNREYEVRKYLADVVLFGSNGGGEAFGFRKSRTNIDIIRVPFVGMSTELCVKVAGSFAEFIAGVEE